MLSNKDYAIQGGVKNFLGKTEEVTAPKFWQSSENSPPTELSYITDAEKNLLLEANLHGSLVNNQPNIGASGILSFDGWGDASDGFSSSGETSSDSGFGGGNDNNNSFDYESAAYGAPDSISSIVNMARQQDPSLRFLPKPKFVDNFYAADGGLARIPMQDGGLMDLGGLEKDYREGGFVPIGGEERADDVPARLSKNEFVFTADAVRNAGGGDIDKGAEVMQNMMDNLEAGGTISEESQGMNPAQEMFDQAQMMEGRLA